MNSTITSLVASFLKYSFLALFMMPLAAQECALSSIGQQVLTAVTTADQASSTVPESAILTTRNVQTATLLPPNLFPHFAESLLTTQREINIQTFLFSESDAVSIGLSALKQLETRLSQEGRQGDPVIMRFILDVLDLAGDGVVPAQKAADIFAGIASLGLNPQLIKTEIATHIHTFLGSNHSKTGLIDGRIGYIGGANFDDTNDFDNPAFDSAYVFKGEVVKTLQQDFDDVWQRSTTWNCSTSGGTTTCQEAGDGVATHHASIYQTDTSVPTNTCLPIVALTRTARNNINNDPDTPASQGFLAAMESAQHHIHIMSPNMNDDLVVDALLAAAERGVKVRVILSLGYEDFSESLPFQGGNNSEVVTGLFYDATPKQLANLAVRWYSKNGVDAVRGNAAEASHLKYLSIDDQFYIVGSSNMDTQSWNHSREVNLGIDSASLTPQTDETVFWPAFNRSIPAIRVNVKPVANAGKNQFIRKGNAVTLSATASRDLQNDIVSYLWEQTQGTVVALSNPGSPTPSFTLPADATDQALFFKLTVTDSIGQTDIAFTTIFPF